MQGKERKGKSAKSETESVARKDQDKMDGCIYLCV